MKTFSLNCFHSPHLCKALFLFCLFLFFLQAKAADLSDYNRQKLFTFTLTDVSVRTVIKHIEKQSEYVFLYTEDKVDDKRRVTVKATNNTIVQVLEKMFQGTSVVWEIRDRQILLKAGEEKKTSSPTGSEHKKTIQGLVKDQGGEPLIGATVTVVGTSTGTTTNIDGLYSLSVPADATLEISYIGYKAQQVKVGGRNQVVVVLQEDTGVLEEVVVTAFGTGQKKVSVVGSVQTIRPSDLEVPSSNLSTSFAGRLAGVIAMQRTGEPGADGANFWIRGVSTLGSASTDPLIVIDGVEATAADLNAIDPEVIEGFSILKDATATAMYGMRGANGSSCCDIH